MNIIDITKKLINLLSTEIIDINSIILVGSNYNIDSLENVSHNSDVDIIVLSNSNHASFNKKIYNIQFDISIINQNDIANIVLKALNKSSFFGKLFSSLSCYNIIFDTKKNGENFIQIIKELYYLFTNSFIPNNKLANIYFHNISANLKDSRKERNNELFFSNFRLCEHLFDYVSYIIYPFKTSGSYRGKIIGKHLTSIDTFKTDSYINFIEENVSKFCPNLEESFFSVTHNSITKNLILKNQINEYYFGFEDLINENEVIFILEKDIKKYNLKLINATSITPFLSQEENNSLHNLLITLSKKYLSHDLKDRLNLINYVLYWFEKKGDKELILNNLRSIFIIKSLQEINSKHKTIDSVTFYNWLQLSKLHLKTNPTIPLPNISYELENIYDNIMENGSLIEKKIKVSYFFFGILKALKLNIFDLNFND